MADNVFDKLDEQSKILARIDKNTANESSTVEEMIQTNDSRMIEFVKTAIAFLSIVEIKANSIAKTKSAVYRVSKK